MSTSNPWFHREKKHGLRNCATGDSLKWHHGLYATPKWQLFLFATPTHYSQVSIAPRITKNTIYATPTDYCQSQAWPSTRAWSSTMSFAVPSLRRKSNPAVLPQEQAPPAPAAPPAVSHEISSDEEPAPTEAGDRQLELCLPDSQAMDSCAAFDAEQVLATGASLSLTAEATSFGEFTDDDSILAPNSVASF